ncbi:MAG: PhzF family phenazine biosynthesis isomerase [Jatrophihabitantaceae bacterium]
MPVERWDVFAREPGGGNPCYLVRGDARSEIDRAVGHAVARRYGGEAALVSVAGAGVDLRFFSPGGELAMCVHASIAAVSALVAAGELDGHQVMAHTAAADCAIGWDDATPPLVSVEQQAPEIGPQLDLAAEVAACLGLPTELIEHGRFGIRVARGARPKLLVPLAGAEAVHAARPEPERLGALCRGLGATGCYVFAPHPDGHAEHLVARQFPVDAGVVEDAATGVAAAALAAYLAQAARLTGSAESVLEIDQGEAMGRPSRLVARAFSDAGLVRRTAVAGQARFIESIRLESL